MEEVGLAGWDRWPDHNGRSKRLAAPSSLDTDVAACSLIHTNHCYHISSKLTVYSTLIGRGAVRVVGEVGNGPNKCNWVGNSVTDARHIRRLYPRDVSTQYIETQRYTTGGSDILPMAGVS